MENKCITISSTGLRNVCTFPAKTRSKVANITTHGKLGVGATGPNSQRESVNGLADLAD